MRGSNWWVLLQGDQHRVAHTVTDTTVLAAIDESGALVFRLSDEDLARSPSRLDDWIAANS